MENNAKPIGYFLYVRKSSEEEDRQVLSIDAQVDELKELAAKLGIKIIDTIPESRSAKEPGRPHFNSMLERITKGEARGILCWKLDRLSRNPIDGGQIQWMLQKGLIQHIQTFERGYYPSDNVIMMSVELGQANQFIRDLSVNVKRGFRKKLAEGWITGVAPSGYLNTADREKGLKIIVPDPDRFPFVRKMWDLMLNGNHSVMQILDIVNNDWKYKTIKRKKEGGGPISRSALYKIFTNTFYYGEFEAPKGSGIYYKGSHKPMITKDEFDRVQIRLGGKGKPRPHTREFAFTGPIRCEDCGCQITAEAKNQIICTSCKFKFGYENRDACPKCNTKIEEMKNPTILNKVYYHGTKRINPNCTSCTKYIEVNELEKQISEYLSSIEINQKYCDWAIKHLQKTHELEVDSRESIRKFQQESYDATVQKLDRLLDMRLNQEITDTEFEKKKTTLLSEKERLQELLKDTDNRQNKWIDAAEQTFTFAHEARSKFEEAKQNKDIRKQREILLALGSNLTLKDRKLNIQALEPFAIIQKALVKIPAAGEMFEPTKTIVNKKKKDQITSDHLSWLGRLDSNQRPSD